MLNQTFYTDEKLFSVQFIGKYWPELLSNYQAVCLVETILLIINVRKETSRFECFWGIGWEKYFLMTHCQFLRYFVGQNLKKSGKWFFEPKLKFWWRKMKIPSFHRLLVGNVKLTFSHLVAALCVQLWFLNYEDFRTEIARKAVKIGDLSFQNIWSFICSRFLKRKKIDPKSTKLLNRTFKTLKKATSKLY